MRKFVYDTFNEIIPPVIVLSTKYHKHLGTIQNAINIACDFNMGSHQEISFDVYKILDGIVCDLWDDIVDLKYIYVPDHNEYYEIQVTMDDADSTVKHCVGISAGECELSQRYLRDFHCNDDTDINFEPIYKVKNGEAIKVNANGVVDFAYDMYETDKLKGQDELYKATVFYRKVNSTDSTALKKKKRRSSLLYRVLHDKCPDWSVGHIDSTLANIQRTLSTDATTVYDFLTNTIATEIGCLFTFDSVNRKINVYDLKNTCEDCGFRGEYVDKCPKCGSKKFIRGYGAYKNVNISTDNTALQISVDGDADSVKNCFRITGGDDLMTATVRNINPNKSSYIYRFSDDMKADMPEELVEKLNAYETDYNDKIRDYNNKTKLWMEKVDEVLRLQTTMMPETPIPDETNAKAQVDAIMAIERIDVALEKIDASSTPTQSMADNAVKGYLRVIVDPRYTVDVSGGTMSNTRRSWQGYITVKSLGGVDENGNEDVYTSTTKKTVHFNTNYKDFLEQKIQKSLDRTDASFTTIFNIEDDTAFKNALYLYSLDRLNSFSNSYQAILEVLIKQGVTKEYTELYGADLYNQMYVPYYNRKKWINDVIAGTVPEDPEFIGREAEVKQAEEERDALDKQRQAIQKELNIETYLGDLYNTFLLYLREDNYNNSNYISDGLNNKELVDRANELFIAAQSDLIKASELQYSLTGNLFNFLNTEEFANFKDEFEIGDYIICKADNKIYRLRITNVSYSYDNSAEIQITFSNIVRGGNFMSDVASVLSKASSMATSFNFVAHQANQGDNANNVINDYKNNGFDTDVYNLYAGSNQDISMDSHGLTAREYDDIEGDYKQEQVILTSHSLAFTEDNWKTASLGLGRQTYTYWDDTNQQWVTAIGYGLNAKFVDAGYIRGSKIVAGDIYSNNYTANGVTGAHINLDDGKFTFANGKLKFDGTNLYIQGDINSGSRIENATIVNSTINTNDNFIVNSSGDVVLNGNVSGTAWATKQDKLGINPAGSATATIYKLEIDGDIYDLSGGSTVVPNPTGTAAEALRKLGIDGTVYSIEGSGTEVMANPVDDATDALLKLSVDDVVYSVGNAKYNELMDDEYEALSDDDKNNDTIYFAKTLLEEPFDGTPTKIGEFYKIDNSKLNPDYVWNNEVKWFFNGYDAYYILSPLGLWDGNFQPPYNHASNQADTRNSLIVEGMPVDTCYVITTIAGAGLGGKYTFFIPKEIIDNGIGCMTRNGFYSTQDFTFYVSSNWGDWNNPADYSAIASFIFDHTQGIHHLSCDQYTTTALTDFTNMPWLAGYDFVNGGQALQDSLDAYLVNRSYSDFPNFYNVNYFNYNDIIPPKYTGTIYLNSINYTGSKITPNPVGTATDTLNTVKIDGAIYVVPDGTTAIDTSYDNTDSGLTATNVQDAIDEISVLEGLANVDITSPTDGQTLVYDSQNQEWVNASGGGGTTVIPNPVGTPTDTLSTIQIGNDIYDIEGSGGGGDGGYSSTLLWDYVADNSGTIPYGTYSVTLNDDINNYDFLLVENVSYSDDLNNANWNATNQYLINVDALNSAYNQGYYNYTSFSDRSSRFYVHDTTFSKTIDNQGNTNGLVRVYGLKFGGTAVTETTLWTGIIDSIGDAGVLNKPLGDYDYLLMYGDVSNKVGEHHIDCLDARMLKESLDNGDEPYFSYEYYDTQYLRCKFTDETHFSCVEFNNCDFHYRKIVGIKINDASGGGTNVEANPTDTPTDTLNTIRIGDTVYDIAGGGGTGKTSIYTLTAGAQWETFTVQDADKTLIIEAKNAGQIFEWEIYSSALPDRSGGADVYRTLGQIPTTNTNVNVAMGNNGTTVYISTNAVYDTSTASIKAYAITSGGGNGSEIIPISAGNDTTTRTFTFAKQPQFIKFYWGDPVISGGWATDAELVWGQAYMNYRSKPMGVTTSQVDGGIASITYNGGKSFTITGANAFGAMNTSNGSGYMYVDYGGSSGGSSESDISDMTWTQIISQAGGAWSTATAIPSNATHVAVVVDYDNKVYMPQTFKLSDWDKYANTLNHSLVEWGFDWKVGSSYDTIQIEYDSTNRTMRTYAGYSGLTLKTYALS